MNIRKMGTTGLIALAILLGTAVSASATTRPTLRLTPNANLHNGQLVRITGTGFIPREQVSVEMCLEGTPPSASTGCDITVETEATTSVTGAFTARVKLLTGLGAGAGCGMSHATLTRCVLRANGENYVTGGIAQTAYATINFGLNTVNGEMKAAGVQ